MAVRPIPREQLERAQAELRSELRAAQSSQISRVVNMKNALALGDTAVLPFRGREYIVPPVPYVAGQRLLLIANAAEALNDAPNSINKVAEAATLARLMMSLFRSLCYPRGLVRRALWRLHLLPNPFRVASEQELQDLYSFFWVCRMSTSVNTSSVAGSGVILRPSMS